MKIGYIRAALDKLQEAGVRDVSVFSRDEDELVLRGDEAKDGTSVSVTVKPRVPARIGTERDYEIVIERTTREVVG